MAVFGTNTKLNGQPPEVTGAQGFGTPAAQQNAIVQGIGGSPSTASSDAKGQSPADKLLANATNFGASPMPMQNGMQQDAAPVDDSAMARQLFATPQTPNESQPTTPPTSGPTPSPTPTPVTTQPSKPAITITPFVPPQPSDPRTRASAPPQPWSATNPMPKPSDEEMANSETAANWYRSFAWEDPAYANITAADVEAYRGNPQGMTIGQWYLAGHRAGEQPAADPNVMGPDDPRRNAPDINFAQLFASQNAAAQAAAQVPQPTPSTPAPAPSPAAPPAAGGTPPASTPPPAGGPPPSPFPDPLGPPPDLPPIPMPDVSNDPWTQMLQKALNAQKDASDNQIRRSVTAAQAATGGLNMGGFGGSVAAPIAEFNAQLDKEGATQLSAAHNSAMDRALQGSIAERVSQTQLQLGRMDVMSKKYTADQALEGEKFRAQIDQAMATAQNASAEKISAAVNAKDLQTARIAADSAATIAASNAAAAAAQAGASLAAQKYASDMAYQGTIQKIAQDRENSQLQFNLGIAGIGNDTFKAQLANQQFMLNLLKDLGPEQLGKALFGGQQLPTPVFVQP